MTRWQPTGDVPPLERDAVHVWRIWLDRSPDQLESARRVLNDQETSQARRFVFDRDRGRYVSCRSSLRLLLGGYLQAPPEQIQLCQNDFGKPELARPPQDLPLRFNVSHSGSWGLIALTLTHRVGADVEWVRPLENIDGLARSCFSQNELEALRALPQRDRLQGFFNAWTRKEAFVKACGEGLSHPLKEFDISLTPGQPPRLLRVGGQPQASARWSLFALSPDTGYVGAVAVECPRANISHLQARDCPGANAAGDGSHTKWI